MGGAMKVEPDEVRIAPVMPEDLERLDEFFTSNDTEETVWNFHPFPLTRNTAEFIALQPHKDQFYVAKGKSGRVLGLAMLRGWDEGYEVPSYGVVVDGSSRGQGIGRQLTRFAISAAQDKQCKRIRLTVFEDNASAYALYRDLGFIEVSRSPCLVGDGSRVKIVMNLDL
jgi:ribosomal protein S18 acetylase RimI-like enzyme